MRSPAVLTPLSSEERDIISRVVDPAPTLRPTAAAELAALFGGAS